MSGEKRSAIELRQEQERKLASLQRSADFQAEASDIRQRIQQALESASDGLKSNFRREVDAAEAWLTAERASSTPPPRMRASELEVGDHENDVRGDAAKGRQVLKDLETTFTQRATALGRQCALEIAEAQAELRGHVGVLRLWNDEAAMTDLESGLEQARALESDDRYSDVAPALEGFVADVRAAQKKAEGQEALHQKRLYLLEAVREVCSDMGFDELGDPSFETPTERGSRIRMAFDTIRDGRIIFHLTLDGITSHSEAAGKRCFEDFGRLSGFLDDRFGIQTQFIMADGTACPIGVQKGELDEPTGHDRTASRPH